MREGERRGPAIPRACQGLGEGINYIRYPEPCFNTAANIEACETVVLVVIARD